MEKKKEVIRKRITFPEYDLQKACVAWYRWKYRKSSERLFMINNESRSAKETARNKLLGLMPGAGDLGYVSPGGRMVFFELKRPGGKQTDLQKKFEKTVTMAGAHYHVVDHIDQFQSLVRGYEKVIESL